MSLLGLHKNEILRSRDAIDNLFKTGQSFLQYPVKVVFVESALSGEPVQVLFMVPKKRFRKAHDRNRLRRLMKESWRLRKASLAGILAGQEKSMQLALVFVGKEICSLAKVDAALEKMIARFSQPAEGPTEPETGKA